MPLLGNCLKALYFDSLYTTICSTKHLIVLFIQEDSAPENGGEEVRVDEDRGDQSPTEDDVKELFAPKKSAVQKKRD